MKKQQTAATGAKASDKGSGMAYKIGAAAVVAGAIILMTSGLLGGVVFASLMRLLSLMGAPEDRDFLPPDYPDAGSEVLGHLGALVIMCGVWMFCLRLVIELLGLATRPALTGRLGPRGRLGLGVAAAGLLIGASAALPESLLYEFSRSGESWPLLETIATFGGLIVLCGLFILIPGPLKAVEGWTNRVGWGKLGLGRINQLGLGLIALAIIIGATFGLSDPITIIVAAGIGIILVGLIPHLLDDGRP